MSKDKQYELGLSPMIEIQHGERFAFGDNWSRFLKVLDENRIREAEVSIKSMLGLDRLDNLTFLDAGSGSGLFSLAVYRLGAKVYSFDYDPQSVATTHELRRRYGKNEDLWQIDTGSVLDNEYLRSLGQFDIVYSWGVLHHTWQNVAGNGKHYSVGCFEWTTFYRFVQ